MGRSTIIYVIGLTLIVGLVLNNITNNSLSSMDSFSTYYGYTQVHNIAVSGANVGTSLLLNYPTLPANFGVDFFGGHDSVMYFNNVPETLSVTLRSTSFVNLLVASTNMPGRYGLPFRDTVDAVFKHVQFAKFSWFTEDEKNGYMAPDGSHPGFYGQRDWKITGDSIYGPAHTNGKFNLDGTPYFDEKVTAGDSANLGPSGNPVYHGGHEWGIHKQRPPTALLQANLHNAALAGGVYFDETTGSNDVALTFNNNQVRVQIPPNGSIRDTTMAISALAPNGLFVVQNADVRIKGTYQGDITVAAFGGSGAAVNKGNVWIDGDVVAHTNPAGNLNSPDMLGIIAGRMAYITDDPTRSVSSVLNLQAAVYCQNGELTAENFWSIAPSGRVNLFGGVTQLTAGSLGTFNPGPPLQLLTGYSYSIRNDPRFDKQQPPFFPYSSSYEMASWWEN
jgi:hypothetical protein